MKKIVLVLGIVLISCVSGFSQTFEKVELSKEEVAKFIGSKTDGFFDKISSDLLNEYMSLNKDIYYLDMYYKDKFLQRMSFNSWHPFYDNGKLRLTVNPVFYYEDIPADEIINLIQNYNWEVEEIEGKKYIYKYSFEVFDRLEKYRETKQPFTFKFYKLIEK